MEEEVFVSGVVVVDGVSAGLVVAESSWLELAELDVCVVADVVELEVVDAEVVEEVDVVAVELAVELVVVVESSASGAESTSGSCDDARWARGAHLPFLAW